MTAGDLFHRVTRLGIGALAVGNVKYQTQKRLFQRMLESDTPLCLDFRDAYPLAVEIAG